MFAKNWKRIEEKASRFITAFGYNPWPKGEEIYDHPEDYRSKFENLLDKSLEDKKDYLEIEYGYRADEIREKIKREEHTTYE